MSETKHNLGLSTTEALKRLAQFGPNEIAKTKKLSAVEEFLGRFKNPLVLILMVAAVISGFLGEWISAIIIISIILLSVILDFVNTYKSQRAAEALREKVQIKAHVYRDGAIKELPLAAIVPGDVVDVTPGDLIPADCEVLEEKDFFVNESSLTGESFPAEKGLGQQVFLGTNAVTGHGTLTVKLTGTQTRYSRIAKTLTDKTEATEFDRSIKDFSFLIMKITFVLVIFIFFVNALLKGNVLESFLFSAALAVGLTPELLPAIIALNLSKGSLAMSRHGVIVKKLSSIQNFGSMDVLCTDKTGTLTEDNIVVVKYVDAKGEADENIFKYAYISSHFRSGFKNPLDAAVKKFKSEDLAGMEKVDEIPFDYARKRDSVIVKIKGSIEIISKGATEEMFPSCAHYQKEGEPLTKKIQEQLENEYQKLSNDGFRVLAVAVKKIDSKKTYTTADEKDLIFLGFIAFLDPPKKSVTETLRQLEAYGVEIKVITGDNDLVTKKVAQEIGLPIKGVLIGQQIEKMSQDKLALMAEQTTIFARVSPDQKRRIISVLQRRHVVGYMGDGINDAPSLKTADVSISVNNAVDVAKESADLILMHKSLKDLVNGVIEGRKTFVNTLKYLMMGLSSNFGNMFSMAGASLFFRFLPMLPEQILFNNLLYDASQFAIPLDNVDVQALQKPRKLNIHFIRKFMLVFGPISSIFDFATFGLLYLGFHFTDHQFQTGWFLESLTTQALVIFIIRTKYLTEKHTPPSKPLVVSMVLAIIIGWAVALSGLGYLFQFTPLPWPVLLGIIVITLAYLWLVEIAKRKFYERVAD